MRSAPVPATSVLRNLAAGAILLLGAALPARADTWGDLNRSLDTMVGQMLDMMPRGVSGFRLGLGPVIEPRFVGDDATTVNVRPVVSFRYRNVVDVDNNNVRINVLGDWGNLAGRDTKWAAGPAVRINFGRGEDDAPSLRGLGDIGTSVELGAFVGYNADPWRFRARIRRDVASAHSGWLIDAEANVSVIENTKFFVRANAQVAWADRNFMNTYYGVTPVQSARSGLPVFRAGSGLHNVSTTLVGEYVLNAHWSVFGTLGYTRLFSSAANGPLVKLRGSPNQFSAGTFVIYAF
jgi:outer membrane scaffolding protein for murein synthesis (MipA/OmpV family)